MKLGHYMCHYGELDLGDICMDGYLVPDNGDRYLVREGSPKDLLFPAQGSSLTAVPTNRRTHMAAEEERQEEGEAPPHPGLEPFCREEVRKRVCVCVHVRACTPV